MISLFMALQVMCSIVVRKMAQLTIQALSQSGINPALVAASSGGDKFAFAGNRFLLVNNSSGTNVNVTIDAQSNCSQGFDHDVVVAIPTGAQRIIGPFDSRFSDTGGNVNVGYSSVASVTVVPLQIF